MYHNIHTANFLFVPRVGLVTLAPTSELNSLYNIFYQKGTGFFTTTSCYRGHSAIVQHNANFATVHSPVTVGDCSVEYEYKLLCQFTTMVVRTRWYLWLNMTFCVQQCERTDVEICTHTQQASTYCQSTVYCSEVSDNYAEL